MIDRPCGFANARHEMRSGRASRVRHQLAAAALAWITLFAPDALAQLRVVNYNTAALNGDPASFENVIAALHDDDKAGFAVPVGVFVFQEVEVADVSTLLGILNAAAPSGVTYAAATYTSSNEDDYSGAQALFYRTDLLSEVTSAHADIYTGAGRRTDRWRLQLSGYSSSAASFYIYSSHLKSSEGPANEDERLFGATQIRINADALGPSQHIIFSGDYNVYDNGEPAYLHFLSSGNGQAFDPLGTASWAGSGNALKHTQSPRASAWNGLVGGGLDDRFDFQLSTAAFSDDQGLALLPIPWAYRSLGNDGAHYNGSINTGNNSYYPGQLARSNALADDLFDASDHIPVVADYQIPAKMAGTIPANYGRVIIGASFSIVVDVTNPAPVQHVIGADALQYTAIGSLGLSGSANDTVLPLGDVSSPSFPLNTATAGARQGRVTLTSSSQGVQPASLILNTNGVVVRHANPSFSSAKDIDATAISLSFDRDTGVQTMNLPVHNFGFDSLQALLDIDGVSGLSPPFAFTSGAASGIGAAPATLTFTFNTDGAATGLHQATAAINTSDENLPGAASHGPLTLSFNITINGATCAADVNGDALVDVNDLLNLIGAWGPCQPAPAACPADINGDGAVDVNDLLALIGAWGACP